MTKNETTLTLESTVSLREITKETFDDFCELYVKEDQKRFVAPNEYSIAEAHFNPSRAWFRGIYADDTPVGFLMLDDQPDKPEYFIWRFMIDAKYQGMSFGIQALRSLIDHVRDRPNATVLLTSVVQTEGGPQKFYEKAGFQLTGEFEDGEAVMALML